MRKTIDEALDEDREDVEKERERVGVMEGALLRALLYIGDSIRVSGDKIALAVRESAPSTWERR